MRTSRHSDSHVAVSVGLMHGYTPNLNAEKQTNTNPTKPDSKLLVSFKNIKTQKLFAGWRSAGGALNQNRNLTTQPSKAFWLPAKGIINLNIRTIFCCTIITKVNPKSQNALRNSIIKTLTNLHTLLK